MDFQAFQYYPLGFRVPLRGDQTRTETTVDPVWVQLRNDVSCNRVNHTCMEHRVEVLACARRLFGDFAQFLNAQDQNPKLSKHAYGLLQDTIQFIMTGKRSMSVASREMLIREEWRSSNYEDLTAGKRTTQLVTTLPRPDRYLVDWLRQPNGYADMLCTVNLLFGTDLSAG